MRFEVTYSKVDQAISSLGDVKTEMEKCQKKLNSIAGSSMFKSGSLKDLNGSISSIQSDVNTEVKECNTLIESLTNIRGIYGSMDNGGNGSGAVEGKNNKGFLGSKGNGTVTRIHPRPGSNSGHSGKTNNYDIYEWIKDAFDLNGGETTSLNFETDLMVVDSMDYLPISDFKYAQVYTGYTDDDGVWHDPLIGLHDSATPTNGIIDWEAAAWGGITGIIGIVGSECDLLAGEMLNHYYFGNGQDFYYDAAQLLQNPTVYLYFQDNVNDVAMACTGNIADGETVIIANSGSHALPGCHSFLETDIPISQFAYATMNLNTFGSINAADAGIVCKITRVGDLYCMQYDYYIIDYYDYDPGLLEPMYNLNTYGNATNYMSYGKISGVATWTADSNHVINNPAVTLDIFSNPTEICDLSPFQSIPGF